MYSFRCSGNKNIKALHASQVSFTKSAHIMQGANSVMGIKANFDAEKLMATIQGKKKVVATIRVGEISEKITADANPKFKDDAELIFTTADFATQRILGINADKPAKQLSKELVKAAANDDAQVLVELEFS